MAGLSDAGADKPALEGGQQADHADRAFVERLFQRGKPLALDPGGAPHRLENARRVDPGGRAVQAGGFWHGKETDLNGTSGCLARQPRAALNVAM